MKKNDKDVSIYFKTENINNTDFTKSSEVFPPRGSFINLPTDAFLNPDTSLVDTKKDSDALKAYHRIENKKK